MSKINPQEAAIRQEQARLFIRTNGHQGSNAYYPYDGGFDFIQDREAIADWAIDQLTGSDEPVAKLQRSVEFTQAWYGVRLQRLDQLMREEAPEEIKHKFFSIVANGTVAMDEPPTYAQQLNRAKWRAEEAERDLNIVRGSLGLPNATAAEMVCKIAEFYQAETGELPMRIQRQRRKGWKAPPNTVSVCRPGPFGNPWTVEWARLSGLIREEYLAESCVDNYRVWLDVPVGTEIEKQVNISFL